MKRQLCMLFVLCAAVAMIFGQVVSAQTVTNLKFGGRIMNDWAWMSGEDDLKAGLGDNLEDGTEFRKVRFFNSGTIHENVNYKLQVDFASGAAVLKDAYIELKGLPVGLKVGHFKEPFGLEELTSSKYITFMERSLINCFSPSRNNGVQISCDHLEKRLTFAAGVFSDVGGEGKASTEGGYNITARVTGLPITSDDGSKILHLGLSLSSRNFRGTAKYESRPEIHIGPKYVSTTSFAAESALLLDVEGALVLGPLSIQAEVTSTSVSSTAAKDPSFLGYYAQASYFITGERRKYEAGSSGDKPSFGRVKPSTKFGDDGLGALELAVRYSGLDLTDGTVIGGELSDITVGLNWHLNSNTRVMLNLIRADLADVGTANILGARFQVDF